MAQIGFYHDMTRCTGCKACQMACKDKNDLDIGNIFRHAESFEVGTFPNVQTYCYSFTCNHCESPACMAACSQGAIYKTDDDGSVIIDQDLCIGCQSCLKACPYGVPQYNEATQKTGKCDACYWLRKNGEDVACASTCPARALFFGEMDALQQKHGNGKQLVNEFPALGLASMTLPSVLVNLKACAQEEGFAPSLF